MSSEQAVTNTSPQQITSASPPVLLFVPGISEKPANSASRVAELLAIKATKGAGTYAAEEIRGPGARLNGGRRIIEIDNGPVLDVYTADYRPRLQVSVVAGEGLTAALRRFAFALWYFVRAFALLASARRRAKSTVAKWQLVIGFGAVVILLLSVIFTTLAVLAALGLWAEPVVADKAADAIAIGATAFTTWLLIRLRPIVRSITTLLQQLLDYAEDERHNASVTGIIDDILDDILEDEPERQIHILGYSLGALVTVDFLYPRKALKQRLDPRHAEAIRSLVTVGCPIDFVRLYAPAYVDNREARVPNLIWKNIYIASDVLGSNFLDRDDGEPGGGDGVTIAGQRPVSLRYTSERLTARNIWGQRGFLSHTGYWDEPERENCLHFVMEELPQ